MKLAAPPVSLAPGPRPLLAPWLAFTAAGLLGLAAGHHAAVLRPWTRALESMGVELPWLSTVVIDLGWLFPAGLLATSAGLLVAGGVRAGDGRWVHGARTALAGAAVVVAAGSFGVHWVLWLALFSIQRQLH